MTRTAACLLACLAALPCAVAQDMPIATNEAVASGLPASIGARIAELGGSPEPRVREAALSSFSVVSDFYTRRGFRPAWTDARKAGAMIAAIRDSTADGLSPGDYDLTTLVRLQSELAGPSATDAQRADFELLMTDAGVRLGYHLWFGKVDPVRFDARWNLGRVMPGLDPAAEIEKMLAAPDLAATIEAARPRHPLYTGLRRELARFREIALRGGWPEIPSGASLRPGDSDARVPLLRRHMVAGGDLPGDYVAPGAADDLLYDAALADAVRRFQRRMGLSADAVIGPGTLGELNVPVEDRIRQLRVNLDRGRVLLFDLPPEFVVVNIAAQEVFLVREQSVVWTARAQVGRPYRRTPEYRSDITYLVFNPTWTVPPGIIRNDILPAARRDPYSITRKGLKVIDPGGRVLDPGSIDWSRFTSGHIPYTLRQDPGPDNALGRVKFMFPNPYAVYLHDTPSKSLFDADSRTTSSGCVRIERPFELAELLLKDAARWNQAAIARTISAGQLQNVTLRERMPVLLAYWTAWVDAQGIVNFRRDVYGRDAEWARALDEPFRFRALPLTGSRAPAG